LWCLGDLVVWSKNLVQTADFSANCAWCTMELHRHTLRFPTRFGRRPVPPRNPGTLKRERRPGSTQPPLRTSQRKQCPSRSSWRTRWRLDLRPVKSQGVEVMAACPAIAFRGRPACRRRGFAVRLITQIGELLGGAALRADVPGHPGTARVIHPGDVFVPADPTTFVTTEDYYCESHLGLCPRCQVLQ
jgi:hypothetical protein